MVPIPPCQDIQESSQESPDPTISDNQVLKKKSKLDRTLDCICGWDQCKFVSEQFLLHGNTGHPWIGNSLNWKKTMSTSHVIVLKNKLFRAAILLGLQIPEESHNSYQGRIRIARHHFPLRIWKELSSIKSSSCIINTTVASRIDNNITHNRLSEYTNSVQFLLTKFDHSEITTTEAQKLLVGEYVCVPTVTRSDSLTQAKNLTSNRVLRQAGDILPISTPPLENKNPPKKVVRMSSIKKKYLVPTSGENKSYFDQTAIGVKRHYSKSCKGQFENPYTKRQKLATDLIDNIFPNPSQQLEILSICYEQYYMEENVEPFTLKVRRVLNDISSQVKTNPNQPFVFEVAPNQYLHTCLATYKTDQCELFTIQHRTTNRRMCYTCGGDAKKEAKRVDRREKNKVAAGDSRYLSTSTVNITTLSPVATARRFKAVKNQHKSAKKTIKNYKLRLEEASEEQSISFEKSQIPAVLEKVLSFMDEKRNKENMENKILNILLESKMVENEYGLHKTQLEEYASRVSKMMGDECKKITGKEKTVRFDPRMIRTALVCFLEDGRKGLNKLKNQSIECVPSLRTVQREYSSMSHGEHTHCPSNCAMFVDILEENGYMKEGTPAVQVLFDEIKLKCGIWFNCTTNDIYGLTPSGNTTSLNFAEEVVSMCQECITDSTSIPNDNTKENTAASTNLNNENDSSYMSAASYANVFRIRTDKNHAWNVAFFLNDGTLDGDALIKQILYVLTCCELAGLQVQSLVSDAGGNNFRAFSLLTNGKITELVDGFMEMKGVSFKNPLRPDQVVFIILCMVHGLKAIRNQFYIGQEPPKGKRKLINNGFQIKWENIVDLYKLVEKNKEDTRNVRELRHLVLDAIELDNWKKMNVHYAKVVFSYDVICYQLNLVRKEIQLPPCFFDQIMDEYKDKIGYKAELLLEMVDLLKIEVFANGSTFSKDIKNSMTQIEFSGHIHYMFIERLLNRYANLTKKKETRIISKGVIHLNLNLEEEQARMVKSLSYFDDWYNWSKQQTTQVWAVHKKHQLFISKVTYRNMKVAITGFFGYADKLLTNKKSVYFVPMLHSNQSSIEAFFSYIRCNSKDNARDIGKSLIAHNLKGESKMASKKSTSYSNNDIPNESTTTFHFDPKVGPKRRDEWLQTMIKNRSPLHEEGKYDNVSIFPKEMNTYDDIDLHRLVKFIGIKETSQSYSLLLIDNESFQELAKLSSMGPAKLFFENIVGGMMDAKFDKLCQTVNSILVQMLVKAGSRRFNKKEKQKKTVVYQYEIWEFLETSNFTRLVDAHASDIGTRFGVVAIIQILADLLEQKLWNGVLDYANNLRKDNEKPLHYSNVNQIFGWSVFSAIKGKQVERIKYDPEIDRYSELSKEINFMQEMRMYKSDAALSDQYLKNCYHDTMRTLDRGRMTLIKEEFFTFGYQLLDSISTAATEEKVMARVGVLKIAKLNLLQDESLWEMFLDSTSKIQIDGITVENKKGIFQLLVEKSTNTWFEDTFKRLRAKHTARGTKKNKTGQTFREHLKSYTKSKN